MNDLKDLVTSMTITGMDFLRSRGTRQQAAKMVYLEIIHAIDSFAFQNTVLCFVILLSTAYIVWKYFVYHLFLHPVNQLPGPSPDLLFPFFGNMREIVLTNDIIGTYRGWARKYGPVFRYFSIGNQPRIVITDPDLLKQVLITEESSFVKPPNITRFLSLFLGNGLLLAEGQTHRYQRKMLQPMFRVGVIHGMVPSMMQSTQKLVQQWRQQCSFSSHGQQPTSIVVSHGLQLLTLEIIGVLGFGQQFDCVRHPDKNPFSRLFLEIFGTGNQLDVLLVSLLPGARHFPYKRFRQLNRDFQELRDEAEMMVKIAAKRKDSRDKSDLLTLMMQHADGDSGKILTTTEIVDQCVTFLAGGHETTTSALSWSLYLLAQHQDIQDALRNEIQTAFPDLNTPDSDYTIDDDSVPSYDEFNNLRLLNNVCKETLRHNPSIPITLRTATKDFVFRNIVLPKGTRVVISPFVSHFDKQQWGDDVDQFVPSRWDRAPANNISPYIYLPFLAGVRQCIGYRFALIEFKVILALLIKNFKFTLKPGFKVHRNMQGTLRPSPDLTLMVEKVD